MLILPVTLVRQKNYQGQPLRLPEALGQWGLLLSEYLTPGTQIQLFEALVPR